MKQDDNWTIFTRSLWGYQYTQKTSLLTPELSQTLYEETQGITDFAAKVYMLAQVKAISTGEEAITVDGIKAIAPEYLRTASKVLSALRRGAYNDLLEMDDVRPPAYSDFVSSNAAAWKPSEAPATTESEETPESPSGETAALNPAPPRPKRSGRRTKKSAAGSQYSATTLPGVVEAGQEQGVAPYESLMRACHFRHRSELFPRTAQA